LKFDKHDDLHHIRAYIASMNLEALTLAVDVARRGSFAAVAKDRNIDPSSVSRAVADLEAELGLRLFQRSTRKLALTEAGALYLARIEPLAEEMLLAREMAASVSGTPQGTLRMTASVTFGQMRIVPLLPEFHARYPELKIEGLFSDSNVDLVTERIDLAVRLGPVVEGDLIASKLMDTHYRVVASPAYIAAHDLIALPQDISNHKVLLFNLAAYRSRWLFRDQAQNVTEVPIQGNITLSPAGSLLSAAIGGLGPVLLPDWLVDGSIQTGLLVDVLPDYEASATNFETAAWMVYPSRSFLPNKVRVMIDFLREKFVPLR
jgi:DNA-binding transcriptional LysR family regulator